MLPPEDVGVWMDNSGTTPVPVFSGDKLGPDLGLLPFDHRCFWILAHSVYSNALVLCQARISKLMAIWDYEGKLEARGWSCIQEHRVLTARLSVPPAKMLRCFAQAACDAILLKLQVVTPAARGVKAPHSLAGLSSDVPFTPPEQKASTRVAAAQADDAEVDLTAWASPDETAEEAKAHKILRRFAVCWWTHNLRQEAMAWWNWENKDRQDLAAIHDCLYRARACSYFSWHPRSRLFF